MNLVLCNLNTWANVELCPADVSCTKQSTIVCQGEKEDDIPTWPIIKICTVANMECLHSWAREIKEPK